MNTLRRIVGGLGIIAAFVPLVSRPIHAAEGGAASADKRPFNIIHILADDVGYDDLGCFGAPKIKTPNLDALAKQGTRFTNFYAPHSSCTPSRAALLTGRYAERMPGVDHILRPNSVTGLDPAKEICIARLLKQRGYATAIIGKWHLGYQRKYLPLQQGFDLYLGIPYPADHDPIRPSFRYAPPVPLYRGNDIIEQPAKLETLPDRYLAEAIKFFKDNKDRPFFLHYSNIETHTPWFVPKRFEGKSADGSYGDAVQCLDWQVGEIVAALDKLGLTDRTLIVFTSDNGPLVHRYPELEVAYHQYGTVDTTRPHVLREGKYQSRYEGGMRVSFIAKLPGKIPAATVRDEIITGCDLFTTFVKLAGSDIPTDRVIDGKDLMPIWTGKNVTPLHDAFFSYNGQRLCGIEWKQWKLVLQDPGPKIPQTNLREGVELYDITADLGEKKNVADKHPDVIDAMIKMGESTRACIRDNRPLEH